MLDTHETRETRDPIFEKLMRIQDSFFDKGMAYSKVVLGLAYAGLLAAWVGTRQYLSPRAVVWSALLILISLAAYVLFEVGQMLYLTYLALTVQWDIRRRLPPQKALQNYGAAWEHARYPYLVCWCIALLVSLPAGLAAAAILVAAFLKRLMN